MKVVIFRLLKAQVRSDSHRYCDKNKHISILISYFVKDEEERLMFVHTDVHSV